MSMVKLKNAIVKAARETLAAHYGRPIQVNGKLEHNRVSLHLGPIGAPIYLPTCYEFNEWGSTFKFMLRDDIRTDAARDAVARTKAAAEQVIASFGARGSVYVGFENHADNEQETALRTEWERTGKQPGQATPEPVGV